MDKLTRLETIIAERNEKEKARKNYIKQSKQFSKRLWFIPTLVKLSLIVAVCLLFYYLGMIDSPTPTVCNEVKFMPIQHSTGLLQT